MGQTVDSTQSRTLPLRRAVDLDDLLGRCLGRMDIVERILQRFQNALQEDLTQLERAVMTTDVDAVAHIAHRIKGASMAVSAKGIRDTADSVEKSAVQRNLADVGVYLEQLKQEATNFADASAGVL